MLTEEVTTEEETSIEHRVEVLTKKTVETSKMAVQVTKTQETGESIESMESFAIVWSRDPRSVSPPAGMSDPLPPGPSTPSAPRFVEKPRHLHLRQGQHALFECQVKGYPVPMVTWLFNGESLSDKILYSSVTLPGGIHKLWIKECCVEDEGEYTCYATNTFGVASCVARLTIAGGARGWYSLTSRHSMVGAALDGKGT